MFIHSRLRHSMFVNSGQFMRIKYVYTRAIECGLSTSQLVTLSHNSVDRSCIRQYRCNCSQNGGCHQQSITYILLPVCINAVLDMTAYVLPVNGIEPPMDEHVRHTESLRNRKIKFLLICVTTEFTFYGLAIFFAHRSIRQLQTCGSRRKTWLYLWVCSQKLIW